LVGKLIDQRRAQARYHDLLKGLDKKYSQGDLTTADYRKRLEEGQTETALASAALERHSGGAEPPVFSTGSESGPWKNSMVAARYGFMLSLPFQLRTLEERMGRSSSDFPILELVHAMLFATASWVLMAAVFGYFYHVVRGRNGFTKALYFSAAMILPTLPLRLMGAEPVAGRQQMLEALQIVAFTLILALLAFDLRTLRKNGYGWRELLAVYGLASAAYGSTIAIATVTGLGGKEMFAHLLVLVRWLAGGGGGG
jgi:hypothetical protein